MFIRYVIQLVDLKPWVHKQENYYAHTKRSYYNYEITYVAARIVSHTHTHTSTDLLFISAGSAFTWHDRRYAHAQMDGEGLQTICTCADGHKWGLKHDF